jgi:hypothetical protein
METIYLIPQTILKFIIFYDFILHFNVECFFASLLIIFRMLQTGLRLLDFWPLLHGGTCAGDS